jgi:redox-sensitive bicupin YhaK (pirin superfamily)
VLHKEYHEAEFSKQGGDFQMVQLWVNLPAKDKMSPPKYQAIANERMGKFALDEKGSHVEVIAGSYNGTQGPATTFTPVNMMNAKLESGLMVDFSFPSDYNTCMIVVEGTILVNQKEKVPVNHFVLMGNDGDEFSIQALEKSVVLVLSGMPILEPIAAHGPFVMNTRAELIQAFNDFNEGKFGHLED